MAWWGLGELEDPLEGGGDVEPVVDLLTDGPLLTAPPLGR